MTKRHDITREEQLLSPGHLACQGCGAALGLKLALKVLGKRTIVVIPACCTSVICGPYPNSAINVPVLHTAFETAAAAASGISAALQVKGKQDINVLAWAGDGGTFDIGLQSLSGAAERNEELIYICYDNEAYMNTGIQRSSATPFLAWTTTTPEDQPKERPKKNIVQIMAGHRIPYVATANIAFPEDYISKLEKAKKMSGTRFIHLLSPCPPGWKIASEHSIKIARLATHAKAFPLYEILDGDKYIINLEPKNIPMREYLTAQSRFAHLTEDQIKEIQRRIDFEWEQLLHRAMMEDY